MPGRPAPEIATGGPLFEGMKAQLAGIASHSGMQDVFRLLGSDVYEVQQIEHLEGERLSGPPPRAGLLGGVRRASERLGRCASLDEALGAVLGSLNDFLGIQHAMVLMLDPATQRLYTVASCGYATSGVGSEIGVGPFRLIFDGASLLTRDDRGALRLDAEMVAMTVKGKAILQATTLSVAPGEFVAIIGESPDYDMDEARAASLQVARDLLAYNQGSVERPPAAEGEPRAGA